MAFHLPLNWSPHGCDNSLSKRSCNGSIRGCSPPVRSTFRKDNEPLRQLSHGAMTCWIRQSEIFRSHVGVLRERPDRGVGALLFPLWQRLRSPRPLGELIDQSLVTRAYGVSGERYRKEIAEGHRREDA